MVILGAIVGVVGGVGAVIFYSSINIVQEIFFGPDVADGLLDVVRGLPWYYRIIAPAVGGLIVGPLINYLAPELKDNGVSAVMEAAALKGGKIRARVAPFEAIASAITIGTGGSAGSEGPVVQIGGAIGSFFGQLFKLSPEKVEALLGAGVAAGIGATFNSPLGGVIFSLEIILRDVKVSNFTPIVVSSVAGTGIAKVLLGTRGAIFDVPQHTLVSLWEVIPYLLLGIIAAFVAILFQNSLYSFKGFFKKLPLADSIKPAIGGLLVGIMALAVPEVYAIGYSIMEEALHGRLPLQTAIILVFAKILATNLTLGSGGSGGDFAPSLFIGAMLGSAYGIMVHSLFPTVTAGASSYAVIGMGAVFAGAAHAPLTSIIILFELTQEPEIILPLMLSCIISTVVASHIQKQNIYTTKFFDKGLDIDAIEKEKVLKNVQVDDVMNNDPITMTRNDTIKEAKEVFDKTLYSWLPVVDEATDELIGMLNHHRVFKYWDVRQEVGETVQKLTFPSPGVIYKDDNLLNAMQIMNKVKLQKIPVVEDEESYKLIGVLRQEDITTAYQDNVSVSPEESKVDSSTKTTVAIKNLVDFSVNALEQEIQAKDINANLEIEDDLPAIHVDSHKVSWVLTHLLVNAIRYTEEGGEITVSAKRKDDWICISVIDNGEGIPPQYQEKIFERYVSLSERKSSSKSGLGLTISKEIIEDHDGRIWVESEVGKGSTFTFALRPFTN
nr:chloride channel protein [Natroniella sulfidigena]